MKQLCIILTFFFLLFLPCSAQVERGSSTIPIADYNPSESKNPEENELRKLRNSKFDMDKSRNSAETINQFRITERVFEAKPFITYSFSSKIRPAFPISASKLIVIGKIIDAKAYLSNDKTAVYSDFTLKIEQVLKQNSELSVVNMNEVALLRQGGGIRFPSGKVYYRTFGGYALPEVGERYLMFLNEDKETKSFVELAGYKFKSGKVLPLDGIDTDKVAASFQEQYQYKDYKEEDFINIVKAKVATLK